MDRVVTDFGVMTERLPESLERLEAILPVIPSTPPVPTYPASTPRPVRMDLVYRQRRVVRVP